jgi:hypothetical protein
MNQSLNLIQDLEFTEATESAETVVGGLSIGKFPVHIDDYLRGRPFHRPRPQHPMYPPQPVHPPIQIHPVKPVHPILIGGPHPLPSIKHWAGVSDGHGMA